MIHIGGINVWGLVIVSVSAAYSCLVNSPNLHPILPVEHRNMEREYVDFMFLDAQFAVYGAVNGYVSKTIPQKASQIMSVACTDENGD